MSFGDAADIESLLLREVTPHHISVSNSNKTCCFAKLVFGGIHTWSVMGFLCGVSKHGVGTAQGKFRHTTFNSTMTICRIAPFYFFIVPTSFSMSG